jgi:uncharacterized membrane protein
MPGKQVPDHVTETVEQLARLHVAAEEGVTRRQRTVEVVADRLGRPLTTYVLACGVLAWVVLNLALPAMGRHPLDSPPFPFLQAAASVAALLVATVILAAQNRQRRIADDRTQLDLQVNLMAERKVAKLIALLEELRRDLPNVVNRRDSLAEAMTEAIDPDAVATAVRETVEAAGQDSADGSATAQAAFAPHVRQGGPPGAPFSTRKRE